MNIIQRMDHFTVVSDKLAATRVFYERLGLSVGPRPEFGAGFDGLWLYAAGHPVLHVVEVALMPMQRRGVLDHMAFFGDQIVPLLETLQAEHIAYRLLRLPRPWSTWQVFFTDPNGAEVEIDFDAAQTVPAALKNGQISPS